MIEAEDLKKTYKMGKTRVKALRGVDFSMERLNERRRYETS